MQTLCLIEKYINFSFDELGFYESYGSISLVVLLLKASFGFKSYATQQLFVVLVSLPVFAYSTIPIKHQKLTLCSKSCVF